MSKIDICTKITSNPFMIRELFAVIRCIVWVRTGIDFRSLITASATA